MKGEFARYALIWLLKTDAPVTYGGVAEAPDGKADVLDVKPADAPEMKLFVDQSSHKLLMLTYEGLMPRVAFNRNGQRPTPEEIEKMRNTPPQQVTFAKRVWSGPHASPSEMSVSIWLFFAQ